MFRKKGVRWASMVSTMAVLASLAPVGLPLGAATSLAADVLSPKLGGLLQKVEKALQAKNYAGAMAAVKEAQALPHHTEYETYTIAWVQAAVATRSGDLAAASRAYTFLIESPRSSPEVKQQLSIAKATLAYNAKDYDEAIAALEQHLKKFGPDAKMQKLLAQSHYLKRDYTHAALVQKRSVDAALASGHKPEESQLLFLATCYRLARDIPKVNHAYVLLAKYYPKPEYWAILIHNLASDSRLSATLKLNLERLRWATGVLKTPSEMVDLVERSVEAGLPQLGLRLMDKAYQTGLLGKDAGAAREARLHAFVKTRAEEGRRRLAADVEKARTSPQAMPTLIAGYNLVLYGHVDEGLKLMHEALSKNPSHEAEASLLIGMAAYDAGRRQQALKTFASIHSENSAQDLAQLWMLSIK